MILLFSKYEMKCISPNSTTFSVSTPFFPALYCINIISSFDIADFSTEPAQINTEPTSHITILFTNKLKDGTF